MSLHFDHSVHGGHGPVWALSVSPRVCDRTTGHISTGASWPGVSSQEETQKSAPLLPLVNLPFTGPGTQAQPKASLAVVCPQDKSSEAKLQGCRGHLPLSQQPPCHFVSADQQPWQQDCVPQVRPLHTKGRQGILAAGNPPAAPPTCPSRGTMVLTWKEEMWGSCRDADSPWVPWMKHLMAQGVLP